MMRFLSLENIILFHEKIINETGGTAEGQMSEKDIANWIEKHIGN